MEKERSMSENKPSRRAFLQSGLAAGAAAGIGAAALSGCASGTRTPMGAPMPKHRIVGANDRINLGLIGCGGRGQGVMKDMVNLPGGNGALVAVCDIWKKRLEEYPAEAEKAFGAKPKAYADYRILLENADVDAVLITTPDHQHAAQCIDAVQAGKHVYVEKPIIGIAEDLPLLNKWYDVCKASKMAVQSGTQGVSSPAARAVRKVIADGRLGKLFRVESTETATVPYWMGYQGPQTAAETDWKAFLFNRKDRPFDPLLHARWMGYHDITAGTIGGWMSHFITLVHFVTGCDCPVSCMAWGGHYAPTNDQRCNAFDNQMVMLDYAEGFHTQFTSHFGSSIDNETTIFMFEKGSIRGRFGHWFGNPLLSGEGVDDKIKPEKLLETDPPYPVAQHVENWFDCIRNGTEPNANPDLSYKHGIAVIMGDLSSMTGRKVTFDKQKREVRT
jgi:predicted dehydrogenase